ncbi:hypothetical protein KCH_35160 [Kitasatospora cheerisanensis KCTC 2395]|uniref:Uncharacterized protein n=1 Tax=Kitasatospora cheerisanensis KCTC 2395 TaxID=1348663 RepID=A0A066YT82_9ACTN|nr:hypothetical protein KCH_35160 [Kitasatospora cheerisanensis KCTC 2395]
MGDRGDAVAEWGDAVRGDGGRGGGGDVRRGGVRGAAGGGSGVRGRAEADAGGGPGGGVLRGQAAGVGAADRLAVRLGAASDRAALPVDGGGLRPHRDVRRTRRP